MKYNLTQVKKSSSDFEKIRRYSLGCIWFGGKRHGEKNSDIDFLVEFERGKSLLDLVGLNWLRQLYYTRVLRFKGKFVREKTEFRNLQ